MIAEDKETEEGRCGREAGERMEKWGWRDSEEEKWKQQEKERNRIEEGYRREGEQRHS